MSTNSVMAENASVLSTAILVTGKVLEKVIADNSDIVKSALPDNNENDSGDLAASMIAARLRSNLM